MVPKTTVLQFLFSRITWRIDRVPYIAVVTPATFFSMSSASSTVRVEIDPSPPLTPPTVVAPGMTISTLVPRLEISACTEAVAPWPRLIMATTALIPMTMPSIVKPALNGLRLRIRKADRRVSQKKDMVIASSGQLSAFSNLNPIRGWQLNADS